LQWLHKHELDALIDTFTWIGVSIPLSGRESYKKFFGVDKYDAALGNLRKLLGAIKVKNANFYVGITLKPTDENDEAILGHPDFIEINNLMGGGLEQQVRDRTFFVDDWQGAVQLPAYLKKRPLYPRAFRPCSMLYSKLMVYSNGKVSACSCRDFEANSELILGPRRRDQNYGALERRPAPRFTARLAMEKSRPADLQELPALSLLKGRPSAGRPASALSSIHRS
jgi:hypothetical protein